MKPIDLGAAPSAAKSRKVVAGASEAARDDPDLLKRRAGWYSLKLNTGAEEIIEQAWNDATGLGTQFGESCAVFKKINPELGLTLYFSPEAQLLARIFGATRCRMPSPTGAQLLLGDARAWGIHFQDWTSTAGRRRGQPHQEGRPSCSSSASS